MLDFITKWGYFGTALIFASQVYKQIILGWEIAISNFQDLTLFHQATIKTTD